MNIDEKKFVPAKTEVSIDFKNLGDSVRTLIQSVRETTQAREKKFSKLRGFVLDNDQWYNSETNEIEARERFSITCNWSEDYFEEYLSRLFPRNPHTGIMDVGVSVEEEDNSKRAQYEQKILDSYEENDLPDILLEQGQNFLVGGAACLFYPPDGFGGAQIISLDPSDVYLGWQGRRLVWMAYYDSDTSQYVLCTTSLTVVTDKNFKYKTHSENTFGFIPFSWIPNMPKAHNREGRSKVEVLFDLDRSYNRGITNYGNVIDEHSDPHRVIYTDAKIDEDKIKRGKNKTTVLGAGDKMENLSLPDSQALEYLEKLEQRIQKKTALVDSAGAVKSAVSGVSFAFQYSGMLDRIAFMRVFWDKAFKEINRAILSYAFGVAKYKTKPVYNPMALYDTAQKTEEVISQVDAGIMSRRDAIDKLQGATNSEEKLKEIVEEKKKYPDLEPKKSENPFEKKANPVNN